jgi:hypothetical protein
LTVRRRSVLLLLTLAALSFTSPQSSGAEEAEDLAKQTQNPVADLIRVPLQSNFHFGVGPNDGLLYILNIQPVIPFRLTNDWNLITRTIVPLISVPELGPGVGDTFGLGDIQLSLFLSPAKPHGIIWGVGPVVSFPSATDDALGTGKYSVGPTAAALAIEGPWVVGALVNNLFSVGGDSKRRDVNQMLVQPFINYNLPAGWYLTSSPMITADWKAAADQRWTVPVVAASGTSSGSASRR